MKITLFGATGKTGAYLIKEGLKRGFELTVFCRSNTIFDHPNIKIIRGDINDRIALAKAIHGADAVLSALGPTKLNHSGNKPIGTAMHTIISVMKQESVHRLIAISTGTAADPNDTFDVKVWFPAKIIQFVMPNAYKDIIELAKVIRHSDLQWTMARVAILKNTTPSQKLNIGYYGHTNHSMTISRSDVAIFMYDQLLNDTYLKQAPGISQQSL